jgi:DNA-directed RNA polymerase II subunit RPB1
LIQDGLLGAYNLTNEDTRINWKEAMNIMAHTELDDYSVIKKNKKYTGAELFSMIIPEKINIKKGEVEIKKGEIKKGRLNKGLLGPTKSNSIIHLVWNEYGMDIAKKFVDNSQRLVNNFNLYNGFSVGIGDMNIAPDIEKQLHRMMETKILETKHLITDMENNPDMQDQDVFEDSIFRDLNAIRSNASKLIIDKMKPNNNFNIMLKSGSKGGPDNIGQMGGCVGQQVLEGARIKKKVNGRALPYFHQNDDTAEGRGFVRRPFLWGLRPTEFIFHNMTSREGLIDTAIRTASSGYIQRKLIKSEEDIYVSNDLTVRTMNNTIIQFIYGDSGIDTTRQYSHNMKLIKMDNVELANKYKFTKQELKNFKTFNETDNNKYYKMLLHMRDDMRESIRRRSLNYITLETSFMLPVNFNRIVSNLRVEGSNKGSKLEPKYIIDKLDSMIEYDKTQLLCMSKETAKNKKSLKYRDEIASKYMFKFALYEYLSPKMCIYDMGISKETFDKICDNIIKEYNSAVIEAGEMVGILSAQSIGEPVNNMAGVEGKTSASS